MVNAQRAAIELHAIEPSRCMQDVVKHKKSTRVAQDEGEGDISSLISITSKCFPK